jgi:hypothetical protein
MNDATMRSGALAFAFALGGCFDGEELTRGKACEQNSHCGGSLLCQTGFCGGADEGGDDDGDDDDGGGNPCELGGNVCVDDETLGVCDLSDGSTMQVSCEERCTSSGYARAAGCATAMGPKHDCYCDYGTLACDAGTAPTCVGNSVVSCVAGRIEVTDCDELCQETGQIGSCSNYYDDVTQMYVYECVCSSGACSEGATFCQDDTTEARCVSGVWQLQPCSDTLCHQTQCPSDYNYCPEGYQAESLGCGYDGSGNSGCRCTM